VTVTALSGAANAESSSNPDGLLDKIHAILVENSWQMHSLPQDGDLQTDLYPYHLPLPSVGLDEKFSASFQFNGQFNGEAKHQPSKDKENGAPILSSSAPAASSLLPSHSPSTAAVTHTPSWGTDPAPATNTATRTPSQSQLPPTPSRRRGSAQLVRRITRSNFSDLALDEVPDDEDAARWAERMKQRRIISRRKQELEENEDPVMGTKVSEGHSNYETAYNMLTGIRFCVSRTNAKIDRDLVEADFTSAYKYSFDTMGTELTPAARYDFKFKDYAPRAFRELRAIFRIDPADYLMSLTEKYILSELGSPGKSGSFFYFSRDYKYIIKTVHHHEAKFLRKIMRKYYDHVRTNPNTLLSQFYGLHRVKMPYGRKIHFVVMNNLFPPHKDIHRTFDLKGSTVGREYNEERLADNPRATLKDLNWIRRNMHLEFGPTKSQIFVEQMERDVTLLQELKIMDYSLLVGIHDLERGNAENLRNKTLKVFQPGGETSPPTEATDIMPDRPIHPSTHPPSTAEKLSRTPSKMENTLKARELRQLVKLERPVPMDQTQLGMPENMLAAHAKKDFYFYQDEGGLLATHDDGRPGEEIYYLGIIDCLTQYNLIKKSEHFFKSFGSNEAEISAIPPGRYGDRFLRFMKNTIKTREKAGPMEL